MIPTLDDLARVQPFLSPGAFFVSGEDNLRITSWNCAASVVCRISGRFLTMQGDIVPFDRLHTPNVDRTLAQQDYRLGHGWILDASVIASAGAPVFGQTFTRLEVIRGEGTPAVSLAVLAQGCCTATQRLAWPGSVQYTPIERPGALRVVVGTDPAVAAEILETVPTGARWRLRAIGATLTTDANAANRFPVLVVDDGATLLAASASGSNLTASTAWQVGWSIIGANGNANTPRDSRPLAADLVLRAGHRVGTITANLQAGDDWSAPSLLVEEWLEP